MFAKSLLLDSDVKLFKKINPILSMSHYSLLKNYIVASLSGNSMKYSCVFLLLSSHGQRQDQAIVNRIINMLYKHS